VTDIQPYRIGWGRLPRLIGEYRRLLPLIARGIQADGQRVKRRRWLRKIRRDLRMVLTRHPKYLLHRPWQAESDSLRFARRGFTPAAARRKAIADLDHELLTGQPSRYQRCRRWRSRRWDRKNLPDAGHQARLAAEEPGWRAIEDAPSALHRTPLAAEQGSGVGRDRPDDLSGSDGLCAAERRGAGNICEAHGCVYPGDNPGISCRSKP
jgi:hypothetical protein